LARRRNGRDDRVDDGGDPNVTGSAMGLSSDQALQQTAHPMPPKIRELIAKLERAGFVNRGGHGSHRNFVHRRSPVPSPWPVAAATTQSTIR
jgi:hypothetical protein